MHDIQGQGNAPDMPLQLTASEGFLCLA